MPATKEQPKASIHGDRGEWDYTQGPITDWNPWSANFDELYAEKAADKNNPRPLVAKTAPAKLGNRDFPVTDNCLWEMYLAMESFIKRENEKPNPDPEKLAVMEADRAAIARAHDVLASAAIGHAMARSKLPEDIIALLLGVK